MNDNNSINFGKEPLHKTTIENWIIFSPLKSNGNWSKKAKTIQFRDTSICCYYYTNNLKGKALCHLSSIQWGIHSFNMHYGVLRYSISISQCYFIILRSFCHLISLSARGKGIVKILQWIILIFSISKNS